MRIHRGSPGDSVAPVPLARWDPDAANLVGADGTSAPRFGSFLRGVAGFDGSAFGVGLSEAATMDPQQRLLLQMSLASLADAGHAGHIATPGTE